MIISERGAEGESFEWMVRLKRILMFQVLPLEQCHECGYATKVFLLFDF
jgi:hypothetical protein